MVLGYEDNNHVLFIYNKDSEIPRLRWGPKFPMIEGQFHGPTNHDNDTEKTAKK